jgi:hypothetical protein
MICPALRGRQACYWLIVRKNPYQLVKEHLETFLAQVEAETGASLPDFVKDEFDAFLDEICAAVQAGELGLSSKFADPVSLKNAVNEIARNALGRGGYPARTAIFCRITSSTAPPSLPARKSVGLGWPPSARHD